MPWPQSPRFSARDFRKSPLLREANQRTVLASCRPIECLPLPLQRLVVVADDWWTFDRCLGKRAALQQLCDHLDWSRLLRRTRHIRLQVVLHDAHRCYDRAIEDSMAPELHDSNPALLQSVRAQQWNLLRHKNQALDHLAWLETDSPLAPLIDLRRISLEGFFHVGMSNSLLVYSPQDREFIAAD